MPPKIIWPSRPRFQKPTRKARLAASPTRIRGAARTSTARKLSALKAVAISSNNVPGAIPAMAKIPTAIANPTASETVRKAAGFQGGGCWRISRVSRPNRRPARAGSGAARSEIAVVRTSCMAHHRAADGLTVSPSLELGGDAATRHPPDAVGQGENLVEILADQDHRRSAIARRQQLFMHRGAGASVQATARAWRNDH